MMRDLVLILCVAFKEENVEKCIYAWLTLKSEHLVIMRLKEL